LHLINGNPSKKPAADLVNDNRRVVAPLVAPECPEILTGLAKDEWKRIVNDLMTMGILSRVDRSALAIYCQAWADWMVLRKKLNAISHGAGFIDQTGTGYKQMSALYQAANRAEERMLKAGALFGLNPSARASLNISAPQGELFPNEQKEAADRFFGSD
ncbi:MAG: phage terminase small subunit P27 family, partial [Oxalicibacterium faecigallinarum]|uniref:phage terminase small subunit P27 family n=1 Tax=Oxalicibacterium faecigallinarum TaxID=573741 RepID=UPI002809244F